MAVARRYYSGRIAPKDFVRASIRLLPAYDHRFSLLRLARDMLEGGWRAEMRPECWHQQSAPSRPRTPLRVAVAFCGNCDATSRSGLLGLELDPSSPNEPPSALRSREEVMAHFGAVY